MIMMCLTFFVVDAKVKNEKKIKQGKQDRLLARFASSSLPVEFKRSRIDFPSKITALVDI
jgi:hypothetical protein